MPIIGGPLSGWLGGAPQSQRYLVDIVKSLGELTFDEQVEALRRCPKAVKELCFLAYGPHELGVTVEDVELVMKKRSGIERSYEGRPTRLLDHYVSGESGDLFYDECERRLVKLFCVGIKPLTEEKRMHLFKEICGRLQADEIELLRGIFAHRAIPGVPRKAVDAAWPGFLDTRRSPEVPEGPQYTWGLYEPMPVADAPRPVTNAPRSTMPAPSKSEAQRYYESIYSKMRWG
jgi:hypothetical protein